MVLNTGTLDWELSTVTTMRLLHLIHTKDRWFLYFGMGRAFIPMPVDAISDILTGDEVGVSVSLDFSNQ